VIHGVHGGIMVCMVLRLLDDDMWCSALYVW